MRDLRRCRALFLTFILALVMPPMQSFVIAQTGIGVPSMHECDSLVQSFLAKWQIPGATVALAKDGKLVYMRGFGTADRNGTEVTQPYHMFRIMSVSKPVTAIAIMKLREEGLLDLDDHIFGPGGILQADPYIAGATISDPRIYDITIRHCLDHSTGWNREIAMTPSPLPPYSFGFSLSDPKEFPLHVTSALGEPNPVTERMMVKFILQRGLNYAPGTEVHYGNMEYGILGLVIEQLTGLSYEEYVTSAILEPLGIYDMHLGRSLLANKMEREGEYKAANTILSSFGTGQQVPYQYGGLNQESFQAWGGWIATARDLVRLIVAVDGFSTKPDILTAASIDTMKAPSGGYAKGWFVDGGDNWNHSGDLTGSQALVERLANGFTWAMIVNRREYTTYGQQMNDLYSLASSCIASVSSLPTFDLLEVPTHNDSSLVFSNPTAHSVTVSWTNGDGDGRLLLARAAGRTTKYPLDGTDYGADSVFGAGQDLGSGNYVVYSGGGNSITINNLFPGGVYHFRLFAFNKNTSTGDYALYQLGESERDSIQTPPADSTSVVSDMDSSIYGQLVTFTATVTPIAPVVGTPTGTVTFKSGATTIGSAPLDGAGQASVSTSALSAGNHPVAAVYGGDASFNADTSGTLTQTVNQSASTTGLTPDINPSSYGQRVTFTVTVAGMPPGGGTPTGMVTLKREATTLGTGVLNGSGQATVSTNLLGIGTDSVTAEYQGSANHGASVSGVHEQIVTEFHRAIQAGWNMISSPFIVGDDHPSVLFPAATSDAYAYDGHYLPVPALTNGRGVWLKFDSAQSVTLNGSLYTADSIHVVRGWNIIGALSTAVSVAQVTSVPSGMSRSAFYGHDGAEYSIAPQLEPGRAYWVKVDQDGELVLSSSLAGATSGTRYLEVAGGELPPPPPGAGTTQPGISVPDEFRLEQNYPNPFNPTTTILYRLPEDAHVKLTILNTLGQTVSVLLDARQSAGRHQERFDASALPDGVYFCRLQAGTYSAIAKMILLK